MKTSDTEPSERRKVTNNKKIMTMTKRIYVEEGAKARLREVFKCSNVMVWKALTFESDSKLARKIRYVALKELGGVPSWKPSEMETTHEEVARTMTQTFGDRVKLVASKTGPDVLVYMDGKEVRHEKCGDIPAFIALQNEVRCMAMSL